MVSKASKTCNLCSHPDRKQIEADIFDGGPGNSFKEISKRYTIQASELLKHRENHMADCSKELVKLITEEYNDQRKKTGVDKALTSIEVLDLVIAKAPELIDQVTMNDVLRAVKLKSELLGTITQKVSLKLDWLNEIPDIKK